MNKITKVLPILLLVLLVSCSAKNERSSVSQKRQIDVIAVLPTLTSVQEKEGIGFDEARMLDEGADYLNVVLRTELRGKSSVRFVRDYDNDFDTMAGGQFAVIKRIGKRLNVDAVLTSSVNRYRQRVGGEYSVDTPASAEFTLRLIDVADGRVVWSTTFKETQQSLMNNLLSFGKASSRGFTWITVEEMVAQGVREKLAECPYIK